MATITIHADRKLAASIRIDRSCVEIVSEKPDFPVVARFTGQCCWKPGFPVSGETKLIDLIPGNIRREIVEGYTKQIRLCCEFEEMLFLSIDDKRDCKDFSDILASCHDSTRKLNDIRLDDVLTRMQRHFMARSDSITT